MVAFLVGCLRWCAHPHLARVPRPTEDAGFVVKAVPYIPALNGEVLRHHGPLEARGNVLFSSRALANFRNTHK